MKIHVLDFRVYTRVPTVLLNRVVLNEWPHCLKLFENIKHKKDKKRIRCPKEWWDAFMNGQMEKQPLIKSMHSSRILLTSYNYLQRYKLQSTGWVFVSAPASKEIHLSSDCWILISAWHSICLVSASESWAIAGGPEGRCSLPVDAFHFYCITVRTRGGF